MISFYLNIVLSILVLSLVIPKAIRYYKNYKKQREKQFITRIHGIVYDYLNKLKQDDTTDTN